jgi:hypothetical protein
LIKHKVSSSSSSSCSCYIFLAHMKYGFLSDKAIYVIFVFVHKLLIVVVVVVVVVIEQTAIKASLVYSDPHPQYHPPP